MPGIYNISIRSVMLLLSPGDDDDNTDDRDDSDDDAMITHSDKSDLQVSGAC